MPAKSPRSMDRSTDCDLADSTTARLVDAEAAQSGLRVELDQARAEAQAARDKVDALTRADEVRRARGRWARLRAAWRWE